MKGCKLHFKFLSVVLAGLLFWGLPMVTYAQSLPALPVSPQIKTGSLDNGIRYYLVKNNMNKGSVSMALVQKTGTEDEQEGILGQTIVQSRSALTDLPRFSATSPFEYMNRKALFPNKEGYVSVKDNATIYRFDNILAANNKEAIDSTLLMIFDIISSSAVQSDRYPTSSQAIIISGDIDQNAFLSKMNMLALLVPKRGEAKEEKPYQWKEHQKRAFYLIPATLPGHASILVEYTAPRTPKEGMNTVQSLTSGKMANEMNIILQNRLEYELRRQQVPCSVVNSSYVSSAWSNKDEKIRITLSTTDEHLSKAMEIIASVLSDLDQNGSNVNEYKDVQNEFKIGLGEVYERIVRLNSNFVDRCISSFLYNAPLSSSEDNFNFFYKRVLDPEMELSFFNEYIQAILHPEKNLRIIVSTDLPTEEGLALENTFARSWENHNVKKPGGLSFSKESEELKKSFSKVKVKMESVEPMTGGKIWTFSNGMRVIYKKSGKEGLFHYEYLAKTGFSQAANMQNREKAYLSDIIGMNTIAGMPGPDFKRMLNANGIHMTTDVSISDLAIKGTAPVSELPLVIKSLIAIGYDRKPNFDDFPYYRDCAALQVDYFKDSKAGRMAVLDSMICPSMSHSPFRRQVGLKSDFLNRANRFYDSVFEKANDGLLILVGNFDEDDLKKTLCRHLGGFKSEDSSAYRSRKQDDTVPGRSLLFKEGLLPSLDLMFDTAINYTAENYMNIQVAAMGVRDALSKVAAQMGWTVNVSGKFIMFPEEKFIFTVQMELADTEGLPASMVQQTDVHRLLAEVNAELDRLGREGLDPAHFEMYRSLLSSMVNESMSDPTLLQDFLVMRYSYGKDLMTKYQDKVNALNVGKANAFLKDMMGGTIAQYGITVPGWGKQIDEAYIHRPFLPQSAPVRPGTDSLGINKLYKSLFE